jgi:hypothetical protein
MAEDNSQRPHPLEGSRFMAALAVTGVGSIGIGLMLAQTLILVGFGVSIVSSLVVVSIYMVHFRTAFHALRVHEIYNGASVVELLAAIVVILGLPVLAIPIYISKSKDILIVNRAFMQFSEAHPDPAGNGLYMVKVPL